VQTCNNVHTYVRTYVYYSSSYDLRKIGVTQNCQEWNNCVTRGAPVLVFNPVTDVQFEEVTLTLISECLPLNLFLSFGLECSTFKIITWCMNTTCSMYGILFNYMLSFQVMCIKIFIKEQNFIFVLLLEFVL
jgi:hypothetical protein